MRLPWKPCPLEPDSGLDEAHFALEEAMDNWPAVNETSEHMRRIRKENHLGEKMEAALKAKR